MRAPPLSKLAIFATTLLGTVAAHATDAQAPSPEELKAPLPQRTMSMVPRGVDTYTAFVEQSYVGAAGLGATDAPNGGTTRLSGGARVWASFLGRVVAEAEAAKDSKDRFAPSLTAVVRVLGDRKSRFATGIVGRYRTEGFATFEGEVEGGLVGSFAQNRLHLDAGLMAGTAVEEREADAEALVRFGYDIVPLFRLGLESRVRRELTEEEPRDVAEEGGEWDAYAVAQATLAFEHFFGSFSIGPQKYRLNQDLGWMARVTLGGIAF